jgi:hypothetical protein
MKKIALCIMACCCCLLQAQPSSYPDPVFDFKKYIIQNRTQTIIGQTNENTIVIPNSSWSVLRYGLGSDLIPCCVSTQYVYFDIDSIVTGKTYKKVFSCDDNLHENIRYEGLIREQDKKTYFIPKDSETEHLLYDFSLEEEMTFNCFDHGNPGLTELLYVKKSDIIEINGQPRKRLQLSFPPPSDDSIIDTWIESIGSLSEFLQPCYRLFTDGSVRELLCHYENNEVIYKNPSYSECYYDKEEDITSVKSTIINSLAVYPNPVDNVLIISSSNETVSIVKFTDVSGKTVYAKRLDANKEYNIDIGHFSSGLYFLHIYDANGLASTFKIIKR